MRWSQPFLPRHLSENAEESPCAAQGLAYSPWRQNSPDAASSLFDNNNVFDNIRSLKLGQKVQIHSVTGNLTQCILLSALHPATNGSLQTNEKVKEEWSFMGLPSRVSVSITWAFIWCVQTCPWSSTGISSEVSYWRISISLVLGYLKFIAGFISLEVFIYSLSFFKDCAYL